MKDSSAGASGASVGFRLRMERLRKTLCMKRNLLRIGCVVLILALTVGTVPFLLGRAAADRNVSGSDAVSAGDAPGTTQRQGSVSPKYMGNGAVYTVTLASYIGQYVMEGGSTAKLSDILQALGFTGEPEDVTSTRPQVLSVSRRGGEWFVTSHRPFVELYPTIEFKIDGSNYSIKASTGTQYGELPGGGAIDPDSARLYAFVFEKDEPDGKVVVDGGAPAGPEGTGGVYRKGSSHTVTAVPNEGYVLWGWLEGRNWKAAYSSGFDANQTKNPYKITLSEDKCLIACFLREDQVIPYLDEQGQEKKCYHPTPIDNSFSSDLYEGWYVSDGTSTVGRRLRVRGDVHLILKDGDTLNLPKGIEVTDNGSLTIYWQRGKSGHLNAETGSDNTPAIGGTGANITINGGNIHFLTGPSTGDQKKSNGIGGSDSVITINNGSISGLAYGTAVGGTNADITIKNGTINVTGGVSYRHHGAVIDINEYGDGRQVPFRNGGAGIGGTNASVTILGGTIHTEGGYGGAGIGGANGPNGHITIKGGEITATNARMDGILKGKNSSAAIGAGFQSAQGGRILITGGTVRANSFGFGAGLGAGGPSYSGGSDGQKGGNIWISGADTCVTATSIYGAGIGSSGAQVGLNEGKGASGGFIRIDDGMVCAISSSSGAGIGGGCKGDAGTITINGGYVIASGGSFTYSWIKEYGFGGNDSPIFDDPGDAAFYGMIADLVLDLFFSGDYSGAGIGCGSNAGGGTVHINGGTVVALGGENGCSAVGWGRSGGHNVDVTVYQPSKTTYGHLNSKNGVEDGVVFGGSLGAPKARDNTFARIEPGECVVYFDLGGIGIAPAPQTILGGTLVAVPLLPAALGYAFDGWYDDAEFTTPFDFETPPTDFTYDEDTGKWKKIIHGKWKPAFTVKKVWDIDEEGKLKPESIQAVLQHYEPKEEGAEEKVWKQVGDPQTLNEAGGWTAVFPVDSPDSESGINTDEYRIRELDPDGNVVYASGDADASGETVQTVQYALSGSDSEKVRYEVSYQSGEGRLTTVTNKANSTPVTVEKSWDIDLEKKDRPDSVQAVVQEKKGDKWSTAKVVTLNGDNDWKTTLALPKSRVENGKTVSIEYRVRELREETALYELMNTLKGYIQQGKDKYDEWIGKLKSEGKTYWDALPSDIRQAADNGYDALIDKLNATPNDLYKKLMEKIENAMAEMRIVYDDKDTDRKKSDDKNYEPNRVSYHVGKSTSAIGGQTDAHVTRYKVDYDKSGTNYKIKNQAILEIDNVKRWLALGVEDKDMPDSAWLVLLYKPKEGALDKAGSIADSAGVDISSVLDYEFPVINPISGGKNPVSIISELTLGVDLSIFDSVIPVKLAIGKATKDDGWKLHYVVSKYTCGIPMEFKGAELGSEVIRQIVKYLTGVDLPVSYTPFDNYFSIPTKAIRTFGGITDPKDLLDFSKLTGALKEKAESLTMDDIRNFGPETLLDDWRLMANVINVKIDFDLDDSDDIKGAKIWKNDKEADRPDTLLIHVKNREGNDIEGSPIELKKADFSGKNTWEWSLSLAKDVSKDDLIVSEEYPEGYAHSDRYFLETDGFTLTNSWHEDAPGKVTVYGQKTWNDSSNADGLRPDSITIHLFDDGEEIRSVTATKAGGWKWHFANLPKYKEGTTEEIVYTISEDTVEGYETEINGYNVTNTHKAGKLTITVAKVWNDGHDVDGIRPHSVTVRLLADGAFTGKTLVLSPVRNWTGSFGALPLKQNGKTVIYTVEEELTDVITGTDAESTYAVAVTGSDSGHFTVTNTHTPVNRNIEGAKTWKDDNNAAGSRPADITIRLLADGEEIASRTVTEAEDWKWGFYSLPIFDNGRRIVYTITEDAVADYTTEIHGFDVTNRYTPGRTQVTVTKRWDDRNNHDGIRPASVTVKLLADGEETGDMLTLSAAGSWTGVFANLDAEKDGSSVAYTVEEVLTDVITGTDGEGTYAVTVSGSAVKGFIVTNLHTPTKSEPVTYKITYKLNGGQFNGSKKDIVEIYSYGTEISIHEAPTRKGCTFTFWKGSEYQPGDAYTVTEDHVFVAQWSKVPSPPSPDTGENAFPSVCGIVLMLLAAYGIVFAFSRRRAAEG